MSASSPTKHEMERQIFQITMAYQEERGRRQELEKEVARLADVPQGERACLFCRVRQAAGKFSDVLKDAGL